MSADRRWHPLLFTAPMVRALMREPFPKIQTRRPITKHNSVVDGQLCKFWDELDFNDAFVDPGPSPAGNPGPYLKVARPSVGSRHRVYSRIQPGDLIWVKETWAVGKAFDRTRPAEIPAIRGDAPTTWYAADGATEESWMNRGRWRPSIHMPRVFSRITLEVLSVTPMRLADITEEDARAEGVDWAAPLVLPGERIDGDREDPREVGYSSGGGFALQNFRKLWGAIHGAGAWEENPWVRRIEFRRVEQGADRLVSNG